MVLGVKVLCFYPKVLKMMWKMFITLGNKELDTIKKLFSGLLYVENKIIS